MSYKHKILTTIGSFILILPTTMAADLYWDGGTLDIGTDGDGASAGGSGDWDTTLLNWDGGASPHVAWNNSNNDTAVFGGTAGTVTLQEGITVGGITFNTAGYTITDSTLTLAADTVIHSTVGTNNSTDPLILSALAGTNGFTKTGSGWLGLESPPALSAEISTSQAELSTHGLKH